MNTQPVILRTFDKPTNIHIIGNDFENLPETFGITDDYASFILKLNDHIEYCDTCGFVFIMTDEEFKQYESIMQDEDQCHIYIENYIGDIGLKLINEFDYKFGDYHSAIKVINGSKNYISGNFNHKEYLQDQHDEDEWLEVILEVNCNYDQIKILE